MKTRLLAALFALGVALASLPLGSAQARDNTYEYDDYDYMYWADYYDSDVYGDYGWEYDWWDGWEYETPYGEWEYQDTWGGGYWEFDDNWW